MTIEKAIRRGWELALERGKMPSQVLYLNGRRRVCFVEGDARDYIAQQVLDGCIGDTYTDIRTVMASHSNGVVIIRRLAARINAWAGYESGSPHAERVVKAVLGDSTPAEISYWPSAREAYLQAPYEGACQEEGGYKFQTSCMDGKDVGRVYDLCSQYRGCIGFIDKRTGNRVGRGNVWQLPDGGLAVEILYGVPSTMVLGVTYVLRREGIVPLDEYFRGVTGWSDSYKVDESCCFGAGSFDAGLAVPPGERVDVGYCDFLGAHLGNDARVFGFRRGSRTSGSIGPISRYGEGRALCSNCGESHYMDGECPACFKYHEGGDREYRCTACGEAFCGRHGALRPYCSSDCAKALGLHTCHECGDVIHYPEHGILLGESLFCGGSCARRAGNIRCDHCTDWITEETVHGTDGRMYCSRDCFHANGERHCQHCNSVFVRRPSLGWTMAGYCSDSCRNAASEEAEAAVAAEAETRGEAHSPLTGISIDGVEASDLSPEQIMEGLLSGRCLEQRYRWHEGATLSVGDLTELSEAYFARWERLAQTIDPLMEQIEEQVVEQVVEQAAEE